MPIQPRSMRRDPDALIRVAERRQREQAAARINDEVPELKSLSIEVEERPPGTKEAQVRYIRRVVVDRAPALFEFPCYHRRCHHGGHDVTRTVMRALRDGKTRFAGRQRCSGTLGDAPCPFVLHYVAEATYD